MADPLAGEARETRICASTGLALVSGPVAAFRIARESYGPLDPPPRAPSDDRRTWSRYDTTGRSIYAADERLTAFMEMLAPYRTRVDEQRRALQPLAASLGRDLDELWNEIVSEWDASGSMRASWLPSVFREGRALYTINFPKGWWVDTTATETIAALQDDLSGLAWPTTTGKLDETLTLADFTGPDRAFTTSIASFLREDVVLDDGSQPLGVQFISKHGRPSGASGICWAYWMRGVDQGLSESTTIAATAPILEDDADLQRALKLCKIRSR